jgi:hypothetical protein
MYLMLRALILNCYHNACWKVCDAHSTTGSIGMLTPCPTTTICVQSNVLIPQIDIHLQIHGMNLMQLN